MRHEDKEAGRLRARLPAYRRRVDESLKVIEEALRNHSPMYVAFSCGKDSAVLFDLVREVDPSVEGRFVRWPETKWIGDFDRVLDAWADRGAKISVLDLERKSLSDNVPDRWLRLRDTSPATGSFIGLRADESAARRKTLSIHGVTFTAKDGFVRCCPLAWWKTVDVAARIHERGLPILSAYETDINIRTVSRVPRDQHDIRSSFLADLRERDFIAYREVTALYPDLSSV